MTDIEIATRQIQESIKRASSTFGEAIDKFVEGERRRSGINLQTTMAAIARAMAETLAVYVMAAGTADAPGAFGALIEPLNSEAERALAWAERTLPPLPTPVSKLPRGDKFDKKFLKSAEKAYRRADDLIQEAARKFLEDEKKRLPNVLLAQFMLAMAEAMGVSLGLFVATMPSDLDRNDGLKIMVGMIKSESASLTDQPH
jgi:hypothetical protein